jgi:hypothetical protein
MQEFMNNIDFLEKISEDSELLEVARKSVEDLLIEFRDSRIFTLRNNGLVIKESDGTASAMIRFGTEDAIRIGLKAIIEKLKEM